MNTRHVAALDGWRWIKGGFELFRLNPAIWITLFLIYVLIAMVLTIIPVVGPIVLNLLAPVFMAGFMLGCQALQSGEELEINHLFAGFKQNTSQLITVGGIYLTGIIIVAGVMFIIGGSALLISSSKPATSIDPAAAESILVGVLIGIGLLIPLIMAYWFAPVLVLFHGTSAVDAMKLSFSACLKNIGAFTVYGLISMVLMVIAAIPIGLGLLVMIPTMTASLYISYRDIFSEEIIA